MIIDFLSFLYVRTWANFDKNKMMKRLLLFLFILSFASCATKKHLVQNGTIHSVSALDSSHVSGVSVSSSALINVLDTSTMDIETVIRRFDTSVHPDSMGKYPLKEEIVQRVHRSYKSTGSSILHTEKRDSSKSVIHLVKKVDSTFKNIKTEKSSVAGGNWVIFLWVGLFLVAILIFYFFVLK